MRAGDSQAKTDPRKTPMKNLQKDKKSPSVNASSLSRSPAWAKKIRIPVDMLKVAKVTHVSDTMARSEFGLRAPRDWDLSGTVFPYSGTDGMSTYCRVRRDNFDDDDGQGKYHANSSGDGERILYSYPGSVERLNDEATTIVLVEAEKSVLACEAHLRRKGRTDLVFLSMGGCNGFRSKEHGTLPDIERCRGRKVVVMLDYNVRTNKHVSEARLGLTALLHSMDAVVSYVELPQLENVNGPDDLCALPDGDELLDQMLANATPASVAPYSEHGLVERFIAENCGEVCYVGGLGWHLWDGHRWKLDSEGHVELRVQELCRTAASERSKPTEQNRIRSRRTREAVLREAQAHLHVNVDDLDRDVMLLNTPGGVVDLRTGQLREARREDYCTKLAGATPDRKKPVRFMQFLDEIACGDKGLTAYLQRFIGYCLTGETIEHAVFFLHGTGANGKSVLIETIQAILGNYAKTTPAETLMMTSHPQHATSIAALSGTRFVAVSEVEDGSRWAESKIKELSGGTRITARFMRQDEFTYKPQFKLGISGNHRPKLRNTDESVRRRFNLIPFKAHFSAEKRDPRLKEKLELELGGILQWAIDGCVAWQREGLNPPPLVLDATEDYFENQDALGAWLNEGTILDRSSKASSTELYRAFKVWCEIHGEYVPSQRDFSVKLEDRGFRKKKFHGSMFFLGVGCRNAKEIGSGASKVLKFSRL